MTDINTLPPLPTARPKDKPIKSSATRSILALILREMSTTYGRSPGGYIWAVLEPAMMIFMLSLGFSLLVRAPSLGVSFPLFYATGYLIFDLFNQIAKNVSASLKFSKALLSYPAVIWLDAVLGRFILSILTKATVMALVLSVILIALDTNTILSFPPILLAFALTSLLGLGVATLNCVLFGFFPLYNRVWVIVTRPLFLASGVIFIYEDLPPLAQNILWWNPLMHLSGIMKTGFYPTYEASYVSMTYLLSLILGLLITGLVFLRRYYSDILEI